MGKALESTKEKRSLSSQQSRPTAHRPKNAPSGPEMLLKRLGSAIASKRIALKMSQQRLADHCNLAQSFLCEIEGGHANPSWTTIGAICKTLGTSLAQLIIESELSGVRLSPKQREFVTVVCSLIEEHSANP